MRILLIILFFVTVLPAENLTPSQADMLKQQREFVEALHQEMKLLRGQVEVLEHDLKTLKSALISANTDNELRFQQLEVLRDHQGQTSAKTSESQENTENQELKQQTPPDIINTHPEIILGPIITPEDALKQAQALIQEKNFDHAAILLIKAEKQNLTSEMAVQLNYWLGEIYLNQEQHEHAAQAFAKAAAAILELKETAKISPKGPEIFWKLAECLEKCGQKEDAAVTITQAEESFVNMPENIRARLNALKKKLS